MQLEIRREGNYRAAPSWWLILEKIEEILQWLLKSDPLEEEIAQYSSFFVLLQVCFPTSCLLSGIYLPSLLSLGKGSFPAPFLSWKHLVSCRESRNPSVPALGCCICGASVGEARALCPAEFCRQGRFTQGFACTYPPFPAVTPLLCVGTGNAQALTRCCQVWGTAKSAVQAWIMLLAVPFP